MKFVLDMRQYIRFIFLKWQFIIVLELLVDLQILLLVILYTWLKV